MRIMRPSAPRSSREVLTGPDATFGRGVEIEEHPWIELLIPDLPRGIPLSADGCAVGLLLRSRVGRRLEGQFEVCVFID